MDHPYKKQWIAGDNLQADRKAPKSTPSGKVGISSLPSAVVSYDQRHLHAQGGDSVNIMWEMLDISKIGDF